VPEVRDEPALWEQWLKLKQGLGVDWDIRAFCTTDVRLPDGSLYGTLCLHHREPRDFSDDEQALLAVLARIAADDIAPERASSTASSPVPHSSTPMPSSCRYARTSLRSARSSSTSSTAEFISAVQRRATTNGCVDGRREPPLGSTVTATPVYLPTSFRMSTEPAWENVGRGTGAAPPGRRPQA
jgi:hypothetical protein